jgi:hypothetical protein
LSFLSLKCVEICILHIFKCRKGEKYVDTQTDSLRKGPELIISNYIYIYIIWELGTLLNVKVTGLQKMLKMVFAFLGDMST